MRKLLSCFLLLCLLTSCTTKPSVNEEELALEMSTYHNIHETDVRTIKQKMDYKETFVVYFGFPTCPWCYYAVPVLDKVASDNQMDVLYINTRKNPEAQSNLDMDDYDLVIEMFGEQLTYDDKGYKHLYTPHVFFVKDGVVCADHSGTVEGHDAHERALTTSETEDLAHLYQVCFETIKN